MAKLTLTVELTDTEQTILKNDDSFTDPIPSNQADFVTLVTARSDYKNRADREK